MEIIKKSLMQWGNAMNLNMENRALFYSPVLKHWRVRKLAGTDKQGFLYDGEDFMAALSALLGTHAADTLPAVEDHGN